MPRQTVSKKDFTFVGGLNTEAGYLTFPANAWVDGDNVVPKIDGSIERRVKIDFEDSYTYSAALSTASKETYAYTIHRWEAVGGNGNLNFLVVQKGTTVAFYDTSMASVSPYVKSFIVDLASFRVASSPNIWGSSPISVAQGNGKLIIVSEDTDPILVTYVASTDTISSVAITMRIRDLQGVADGYAPEDQPATLTALHYYNLKNQGWDHLKTDAYFASQAKYPANSQMWIQGKDSSDNFDPALLAKQDFGSSLAPKGRFLLNPFYRNRDGASGVVGIPSEIEATRPRACAFFAGRAWYAGIDSETIGSWVLFSQVANTDSKYGLCFQEGDPTAEYTNDLVASDGGVILLPDAGSIVKMVPVSDSLIVLAENGIWQILGDSSGFSATGYQTKKITSFGCVSAQSVVEFENTIAFWSISGIFTLQKTDVSGEFVPVTLTQDKIQTMYAAIAGQSKKYSQGFYSQEDKKIIWMYQASPNTDTITDRFKKDKFLILDLRLKAFYTYTIPSLASNSPLLLGGMISLNLGTAPGTFTVNNSTGDTVITSGSDTVVVTINSTSSTARIPKYLTITPSGSDWVITFSDFQNVHDTPYKFMDWYTKDSIGVEPSTLPYVITGYTILEEGDKVLQAPYITTFMKRTETGITAGAVGINQSSATLQGRWEWTDNAVASRWTSGEELYRRRHLFVPSALPSTTYVDGYPVVVAKSKIRGKGHSLHIRYQASTGKDMKLIGWSILYNKNANV